MRIAKKTSGILLFILSGFILLSCSSAPAPKQESFTAHLNDLIRQLGDYDYTKQEMARREIMNIANNLSESLASNPGTDSSEIDYLISALEYAAKSGCPPGSDTKTAVNAAVQIRAEKLCAAVKYSGIIHPDLVKLNQEIITHLQKGEDKKIMDWLSGQTPDIQKKAIQFYKYALKSTTPAVRREATKSLITFKLAKYVLPLLMDKDLSRRQDALLIITNSDDFTLVPNLLPLLKEKDYQNSESIIRFVGNSGDKAYIKELFPLLKEKGGWMENEIVKALLKLGGLSIIKEMLPLLKDDDQSARWAIVEYIRNLQDKSALDALLPFLQSEDVNIRQAVVTKILEWKGQNDIKYLLPLLKDESVVVRREVVQFLFEKINGADKSLVNTNDILPMLSDTDESIRWQGVCIMLQVAGKSAIKHLLPLLKDSDAQIRGNVARLLIGLEDKSLIPEVLPLLEDTDKYVRLSAIESLAYLGDDEIIEKYGLMDKLVSIAKGRDKRLKFQAIEVAVRIGQGDALEKYGLIDELVSLIDDGDEWLMTHSITIAGKYGTSRIIKKILPFLKDKRDDIKLSAAWALTQQGDIRAVPVWIENIDKQINVPGIHDGQLCNTPITYAADEALRKLTGQTSEKRYDEKLWKEWWVKEGQAWYEQEVKKIKDE